MLITRLRLHEKTDLIGYGGHHLFFQMYCSRRTSLFNSFQGGVLYLSVTITKENLFSLHLENSSSPQFQLLSHAVEQKVRSRKV